MRRRLFVALTAATSLIGAFGTAAALPTGDSARSVDPHAEWFGYEGVTVAPVGLVGAERLAVLPEPGQTGAVLDLLGERGVASVRDVGGVLDVTAPSSAVGTIELSPAVAEVGTVQRAHETTVDTTAQTTATSQGAAAAGAASATDSLTSSGGSLRRSNRVRCRTGAA